MINYEKVTNNHLSTAFFGVAVLYENRWLIELLSSDFIALLVSWGPLYSEF